MCLKKKKMFCLRQKEYCHYLILYVSYTIQMYIKINLASQYSSYNCANKFRNILALVPHEFTKKYIHILYTYIMSLKSTYIQMQIHVQTPLWHLTCQVQDITVVKRAVSNFLAVYFSCFYPQITRSTEGYFNLAEHLMPSTAKLNEKPQRL